jgi:hypothetical protein
MMSDPCIAEFNNRVARIHKARSKGYAFEAEGTLGRSFYTKARRRPRRSLPLVRPVVVLLVLGTLLKAIFLHQLGAGAYDMRVAHLLEGEGFDRIGGWLMQADPVTKTVAHEIATLVASHG